MRNRIAHALVMAADYAERLSDWLTDLSCRVRVTRPAITTAPPMTLEDYAAIDRALMAEQASRMLAQPNQFSEQMLNNLK